MPIKSKNIQTIQHPVSDQDRWQRQGYRGGVLWLTGLPIIAEYIPIQG